MSAALAGLAALLSAAAALPAEPGADLVAALEARRLSPAEALARVAARVRAADGRASALEEEVAAVQRQLAAAAEAEAEAAGRVQAKAVEIAPRLRTFYRLTRRRPLESLLEAEDFATLLRTSRGLSRVLLGDLSAIQALQEARRSQAQALRGLDARKAEMSGELARLEEARSAARESEAELLRVVARLQEALRADRRAGGAEAAAGVARLRAALERPARTGFGALRGQLPWPVEGSVEVGFGRIYNARFHTEILQKGLHLRAPAGAPVRAVAGGRVVWADWIRGLGNVLVVEHPGQFHTVHAHLAGFARAPGDGVSAGDVLGRVGDTDSSKGAYLHFELRQSGWAVDPLPWLSPAAGGR
jgi:septal ring factor EnvC (AmiA/AmiB activator)